MDALYSIDLPTAYGLKKLSVISKDITEIDRSVDVLTTSSFCGSYSATPGSIFGALSTIGVDVQFLSQSPLIDLRNICRVWLSNEIEQTKCAFGRIGCIEFNYKIGSEGNYVVDEELFLRSLKSYFHMLDIAAASGIRINTVAMPLLGTGTQRLSQNLIVTPLLNECVAFLKRNEFVQNIFFIDKNPQKALSFVKAIKRSYSLFKESSSCKAEKDANDTPPMAFISYTTSNRNIADNLCFKLESKGIKVWYAPRNVDGPYAAAIAEAIEKSSYFIVILSRDSMLSEHMLNEIDLAFKRLPSNIKFKPLRIDTADLTPSFNYYLSRQHWMDAHIPPLEARLDEFVESLVKDLPSVDTLTRTSETKEDVEPDNGACGATAAEELFDSDSMCESTVINKKLLSTNVNESCDFDADLICTSACIENDDFDAETFCETKCANAPNSSFRGNKDSSEKNMIMARSIHQDDVAAAAAYRERFMCFAEEVRATRAKIAHNSNSSCAVCGSSIKVGSSICPCCGTSLLLKKQVKISQVQFSAVVPKRFIKGEYSMVDIAVYEEEYRKVVEQIIENADDEVKEVIGSTQSVEENTMIRIVLSSPDLDISECDETQLWKGKFLTYSFPVKLPANYAQKQILFIASVYFNGVIATKLKFVAKCSSFREQKIELSREDVLTAFISYASQDRSRVATIIQGMKKARPDMDIFFDVESLRSGEDWEEAIKREIEKRDVLFLCWSKFASESKWVDTEWRYALVNKGLDSIEPIPLVSPAECPPPLELNSKHFNDKALLYK